jgi:multidrug efflux pump subunit AcrB
LFPTVDAGQIRLHLRAPTGTRVEETAALCDRVEASVRKTIPPDELAGILDNIGLPYSGINLSYSTAGTIGTSDAEILISLDEKHHPTADYVRDLRKTLPAEFPGSDFFFQPADIVSQILNFGLPSPIDVQLIGPDLDGDFALAGKMLPQIKQVGGAADVHIQQTLDLPKLKIRVDRSRAETVGFTQQDVAGDALTSLTTSFQTAPNFWISPQGVPYSVSTQTPQYRVDTMQRVAAIPVINRGGAQQQLLDNVADIERSTGPAIVSHYNIQPVIDIYAAVQGRDLGGVASDIQRVVDSYKNQLPRGTRIVIRGQVQTMRTSFFGLGVGLVFSILLVYLLMVVNFQSWTDPFIIITALTGTFAGIVWMLFVTHTTMSVPSLMGAIMGIGVATSNSILLVTFAGAQMQEEGKNSIDAARSAGYTRLRPIIMTALAMIIGMLPMSLGLGEGGEQNAPLGRAVIGGLLFATVGTLFFVPVVYSFIRRNGYTPALSEDEPVRA